MWAEWNNQVISLKGINLINFSSYFPLYNCKRIDWNKLIEEKNLLYSLSDPSLLLCLPKAYFVSLQSVPHCRANTGNIAAISSFPKPVNTAQASVSGRRFGILKQNRQKCFQSRWREFPVSTLSPARIMLLCTLHPPPTSKGI